MAKAGACIIWLFMLCLTLSGIHGKLLDSRASKKSKTTTELHQKRLKETVKDKNLSNIKNAKQDGGNTRQVLTNKTKNSTNTALKRTMKEGARIALKNTVNLPSLRRPLKLLRLKTANPRVRSRLTSLRSSTFRPIHIYGSVPFKTFLTALSKSNSQGVAGPTPAVQSQVPQVGQTLPNMPMESQLSGAKALQARQFLSPGAMGLPVAPQGGMPMLLGGAGGGFNGAPLDGAMPMLPPEDMASFYGYPVGYHDHHSVNHHLHRKGKGADLTILSSLSSSSSPSPSSSSIIIIIHHHHHPSSSSSSSLSSPSSSIIIIMIVIIIIIIIIVVILSIIIIIIIIIIDHRHHHHYYHYYVLHFFPSVHSSQMFSEPLPKWRKLYSILDVV
jgi:hypothetical protein